MSNILVTGSNGQLGSEIKSLNKDYSYKLFFTTKDTLDITNKEQVESFIKDNSIDTIINCAAYTNVEKAEDEKELAELINHKAVENLALIAKSADIKLIHISTDYVFDGKKSIPYTEDDTTNPLAVYATSKLLGEVALQNINPKNSIIIRTSWVYSSFGNNFVKTMLKLAKQKQQLNVIADQVGTPTYANDLAKVILDILPNIDNIDTQIYHYSNEGVTSWYDFASVIMQKANTNTKVSPIESKDYPSKLDRPYYTLLNKSKIKNKFNITIPFWQDSLDKCLKVMENNNE